MLWAVNGWQTFGEWHEAKSGGYLWNWRPSEALSIVNSGYAGQEVEGDPGSLRLYTNNDIQLRYYKGKEGHFLRSLAFSLVADVGYFGIVGEIHEERAHIRRTRFISRVAQRVDIGY